MFWFRGWDTYGRQLHPIDCTRGTDLNRPRMSWQQPAEKISGVSTGSAKIAVNNSGGQAPWGGM